MTTAKTTVELTTYDIDNLTRMAEGTGLSKGNAFHYALEFCSKAVDYMQRGYVVSSFYENSYMRSTTATISPVRIADVVNNRRTDVDVIPTDLPLHRVTADRLENIKRFLKIQSDTLAVAFALEYARTAFDSTQSCNNGKKATIFFSKNNRPGERGYLLSSNHPFNANLGNKFRRASRRMKTAAANANPFRKKPAPPALPAPAAPAPAPAAAVEAPAVQEIKLLNPPTVNKRPPRNDSGNQGGFGL